MRHDRIGGLAVTLDARGPHPVHLIRTDRLAYPLRIWLILFLSLLCWAIVALPTLRAIRMVRRGGHQGGMR